MALDLNKYRALFLEEATEHLGEISRALLELEKEPETVEAIDTIFRMAHSIKSMAASLGYDGVSQLSHALEDRMERVRSAGRVNPDGLGLLFRGLESLEAMVGQVRETGEAPATADPGLLAELSAEPTEPAPARATVQAEPSVEDRFGASPLSAEPTDPPALAPTPTPEEPAQTPPEKKARS